MMSYLVNDCVYISNVGKILFNHLLLSYFYIII